jgi:tetratricopeptide (TPR) repeat protein
VSDAAVDDLLARASDVFRGVVADPARYSPVATRLLDEARRSADAEALVVALRAKAWAERARLADGAAKSLLDEAARVARQHGLSDRLGEVLTSRGAVNLELGRIPAARKDLDRAYELARSDRSSALLQMAVLLHNTGRLREAAAHYRRAREEPGASAQTRTTVANNMALVEMAYGHVDRAVATLDEAARDARGAGPAHVALVAQSRAWVAVQAGRVTEGLARFDEAAVLYQQAGLPLAEHYLEYVDALLDLRLLPEALATCRRAVAALEESEVPLMAAEARWRLARLALLSGDAELAATTAEKAVRTFREQHRPAWAAQADVVAVRARTVGRPVAARDLATLRRAARRLEHRGMQAAAADAHLAAGRAAISLDRPVCALEDLDRAWVLARRAPVLQRLTGRVAAALAATVRRQDGATLRIAREGLADLAVHRSSLESAELRALASGHGAELGRIALRVALRGASPARVLDWMERTRAASVVAVEPRPVENDADLLADLRAAHVALEQAVAARDDSAPDLSARVTDLEALARKAAWVRQGTAPQAATAHTAATLRAALGARVLTEYAEVDGELVAVVLDRARPRPSRLVRLGPVGPVRREVDALLFALRRLAMARTPASVALARQGAELGLANLRDALVAPLRLPTDRELVVVPASSLWRAPWSALHDAAVSVAPSAAQWVRTRAPADQATTHRTVLVAGPDLPGAVTEVEALRAVHPDASVLVPPASNVVDVAAAVRGADLAHLACHSALRADNPAFSGLRLSDGPLSVHEIDLRGLAPRRVVLAACDSAADVAYEGNDLLGFVSALLARGTTGLVASVVPVPDLDAVALMCGLHQQLARGERMAGALHAARRRLDRDDPRSFVNWCAFSAFGAG